MSIQENTSLGSKREFIFIKRMEQRIGSTSKNSKKNSQEIAYIKGEKEFDFLEIVRAFY